MASYTKNNISLRASLYSVHQGLVPGAALAQGQSVGQPGALDFAREQVALWQGHGLAARHGQRCRDLNGWR
jgi:hypothetical protein